MSEDDAYIVSYHDEESARLLCERVFVDVEDLPLDTFLCSGRLEPLDGFEDHAFIESIEPDGEGYALSETLKPGDLDGALHWAEDGDDWTCARCGASEHDEKLFVDDEIAVDVTCESVYFTFNDDAGDPGMAFDHETFERVIDHYREATGGDE